MRCSQGTVSDRPADEGATMITRREFLAASSASLLVTAVGTGAEQTPDRPWYATMRRCGQLNLNERDPLTLDVASWIDYWDDASRVCAPCERSVR